MFLKPRLLSGNAVGIKSLMWRNYKCPVFLSVFLKSCKWPRICFITVTCWWKKLSYRPVILSENCLLERGYFQTKDGSCFSPTVVTNVIEHFMELAVHTSLSQIILYLPQYIYRWSHHIFSIHVGNRSYSVNLSKIFFPFCQRTKWDNDLFPAQLSKDNPQHSTVREVAVLQGASLPFVTKNCG
jgi:hypothetical protein